MTLRISFILGMRFIRENLIIKILESGSHVVIKDEKNNEKAHFHKKWLLFYSELSIILDTQFINININL
ncbi:hypothetical protein J2S17_000635 [Cytobacillus purgationiresistens]|uniref:Uncharacterized protein n=1 Tax=Cytobacillus purgationiresistens TaxID=863449 RepID=A0ABU0ABY4_9BACI|nr:hypothetical protein [Cytobacillus purgationiresistens]